MIHRFSLLLPLLFAVLAATAAGADAGARVALRATVDLPGTRYALGDIADIEGGDAGLRQRLAALPIGTVPRQGYTEPVSREQIEALVRQQVPLSAIDWDGAAAVRIRGRGQRVPAEQLSDAAVRALHAALAGQYTAIELQPLARSDGVNVPAGAVRLAARVPPAQRLGRRMNALVDVSVDGEIYTTVPVWFAVRASRPVLVARAGLQPGEALHATDFELRTVDVTEATSPPLPGDAAAVAGMRLRRALEPGAPLAAAHVEARPPVARAAQVAVRVVQGAVTIETVGTALADARLGETVKVRNTSTNEAYAGRVIGDGVVLVSAR